MERSGLGPASDQRLFERQFQVTAMVVGLVQIAHIVSSFILVGFAIPSALSGFRLVWCASMVASSLFAIAVWLPRPGREPRPAQPWDVPLMMVVVVVEGLLYAWLALETLPGQDVGQRMVLLATVTGVLGSGAIALSTIRPVALTWVWANVIGLAIAFNAQSGFAFTLLIGEVILYGFVLSVGIVFLSDSFAKRCRSEFAAENDHHVIRLLLDDFEGGARDWLWESDTEGVLSRVSARLAECAGRPREELQGLALTRLLREAGHGVADDEAHAAAVALIDERMTAGQPFRDVTVAVMVGGEQRWWNLSGNPGAAPDGHGHGWRGVGSDITDAVRQRREILQLVNTDALTGIGNRRALSERLDHDVRACRDGERVAFGILDLDNFKSINDTLGHPVGDTVLSALALRISDRLGPTEFTARMGGDEFAIVLTQLPKDARPALRYEELLGVLREPFLVGGTYLELRGSLGHAAYPDDAQTAEELVMIADLALYAAKDAGRDQVRRYDHGMRDRASSRAVALQELRHAISHGELVLEYQPQVTTIGGLLTGFEALVRWQHPTRGLVSPLEFITVAEETGLIVPLGDWVAAEACRTAAEWPDDLRISINVSRAQLVSAGILDTFARVVAESGIARSRVEVEITESGFLDDLATDAVHGLAQLGLSIAVDDFGTGYSSLAVLRTLPVSRVKIDRAFVRPLDIDPGPGAKDMLAAIVHLAGALGLETIAEGVETRAQRDIVAAVGCPQIQGFLESRPMRREAVRDYLAVRSAGNRAPGGGPRSAAADPSESRAIS